MTWHKWQVNELEQQLIYDYFRENIDTILLRAKANVIAEVGLTFCLVGLEGDPVFEKTRLAIQASIDGNNAWPLLLLVILVLSTVNTATC